MDQYLLIPFLVGWTSIYQLFWCSPGVQGFDTLPIGNIYGVEMWVAPNSALSALPAVSLKYASRCLVERTGIHKLCRALFEMGYPTAKNYLGLSENRVYSQWNSHLIGIMIINPAPSYKMLLFLLRICPILQPRIGIQTTNHHSHGLMKCQQESQFVCGSLPYPLD